MRVLEIALAGLLLWAKPAAPTATKRVEACALFNKAEIQALIGRAAMDGRKSEVAELSSCSFGNPKAPLVNGQPTDVLLTIDVFNGERPGQAKGAYDIAKKNTGDVKPIGGVGDEAYWDDVLRVFRVVKGNVGVDVTIASDLGGLKTARAIAENVVAKLP
jgi:hypothetical protein